MRTSLLAGLLLALAAPVLALDRSGTIMEARVYFDNTRTLDRLGDLAGELDVSTWDEDETGGYLVINTDAEQFDAIRACGLRIEVTWADIRDKFRFETGVDPDDLDAGRDFGCYLTYWEVEDTLNWLATTYAFTCELSTGFWTGWDNPSFVANEVNINIPNLYYLARVSGVYFEPLGVTVNDTTLGNGSGEVDPDEAAELWFRVRNRAVHPCDSAVAVNATLRSGLSCLVVEDSQAGFPNIPRRSDADNQADQFRVRAEAGAQPGTVVPLTLELAYDDLGSDHVTELEFEITIGNAVGLAAGPQTGCGRPPPSPTRRRTGSASNCRQQRPARASGPTRAPAGWCTKNRSGDGRLPGTAPACRPAYLLRLDTPDGSQIWNVDMVR